MKKLLSTILCLAAVSCVLSKAQTSQYSVNVEPFTGVDISGSFEVSILRGSEYRVLVTVLEPYRDYVECYVGAGILNLTLDEKKVPAEIRRQFRGRNTPDPVYSAVIYVPELLQNVRLSDKAVLHDSEDVFDKARINISMEGSSNIRSLKLSSLVFSLDMRGKSSAELDVTCRESEVNLANSTNLKIEEASESSYYTIQGSSKTTAEVNTRSFRLSSKSNCSITVSGVSQTAVFDMSGTSEADASRFEVNDASVTMSSVCKLSVAASDNLKVNLNGGPSLFFAGNPVIEIDNIRSATMSRLPGRQTSTKL